MHAFFDVVVFRNYDTCCNLIHGTLTDGPATGDCRDFTRLGLSSVANGLLHGDRPLDSSGPDVQHMLNSVDSSTQSEITSGLKIPLPKAPPGMIYFGYGDYESSLLPENGIFL